MSGQVNLLKISKFCFIFVTILILNCCDDDFDYYVPEVPVNIELNINNELMHLGVGETVIIVPDSLADNFGKLIYANPKMRSFRIPWRVFGNGVIIYRAEIGTYLAYDRTCTYKPFEENCGVTLANNMLLPTCPCCGSKFMITARGVATRDSKAVRPLMPLQTSLVENGSRLIISKMY